MTTNSIKNLLFISHDGDFKGGAEISGLELLKSAQNRGYNVIAVVPNRSGFYDQLQKNNIEVHSLGYSWHVPPSTPLQSLQSANLTSTSLLAKLITDKNIDVVISNSTVVPWGALAAALTDTPHIWICREFPEDDLAYIADYYDFIDSFSNKIIANSENVALFVQDKFNLKQVSHFYSYVDTSSLSLSSNVMEPRIIQVGNISSRKNQLELILAAGILKKQNTFKSKILFIGHIVENEYYNILKENISKLGLEDAVTFVPFTNNPWELINENDIFIQTSSSESIGRTTTEAMKLGLICIGSNIPGVKEAFALGGGHLYTHGDATDLSIRIEEILSNPGHYKKIALSSQVNALKNMSEKACHNPFFMQLESLETSNNPQRQLRHMYMYTLADIQSKEKNENDLKQEIQKSTDLMLERSELYKKLDGIYQSKSWKLISKFKLLIGRK
jgi:glycosyltransferase involved in cell wall biosynthesis